MAFIAISVPSQIAQTLSKIEVPGKKEDSSKLHITLLYLGDDLKLDDIFEVIEATHKIAQETKPFSVEANSITSFPKGDDKQFPVIVPVKSKELHDLNKILRTTFNREKIEYSKKFKDYNPHITLSYSEEKPKDQKIDKIEFKVEEITFWTGNWDKDQFFITFPLGAELTKSSMLEIKSNAFNKCAKKYLLKSALSGNIEAWHVGKILSGNTFSLDFLGHGEGMNYLGPGIYFSNNKDLALRYAKYHSKPSLYKVSIPANNLYDPVRGEPLALREKIIKLQENVKEQLNIPKDKYLDSPDNFKYGKGFVGFLNYKFGKQKCIEMLKEIGINGIYENLPGGSLEICVLDPSIITMMEKEELNKNNELTEI